MRYRFLLLSSALLAVHAQAAPPTNDNCSGAAVITPGVTCVPVSGSVSGATPSLPAITCNGATGDASDDVWFRFTATNTTHTIEVTGGTGYDAVVDLRTGGCDGTNVACADETYDGETEVLTASGFTVGTTYYIRVYDYNTGPPASNTLSICISGSVAPTVPVNDECSGAVTLPVSAACTPTNGTTVNATQSGPIPGGCAGTPNDVWYRFVAPGTSAVVTVDGLGTNGGMALYSGSCASLSLLDCFNTSEHSFSGLSAGQTYWVRVYDYFGAGVSFNICVRNPPGNDDCSGAITLPMSAACNPVNGTLAGATYSATMFNICGDGRNDVWYRFVATGTAAEVEVYPSTGLDALFTMYSSDCANPAFVGCFNDHEAGMAEV
ncbi:MAG TPA: hypothetical protein VHL57_05515, partial [Flavobacteriales bacterium]|nr:hypothetical protein [Flavobacteriales bacterium]